MSSLLLLLMIFITRAFVFRTASDTVHKNLQQGNIRPKHHCDRPKSLFLLSDTIPSPVTSTILSATSTQNSRSVTGGSYIRWNTRSSEANSGQWELQTAVTTFQRTNPENKRPETVELHAQVHYGSREYFDYYNRPEFTQKHDHVLYEMLVDAELLELSDDKSGRTLKQQLVASPSDQTVAQQYGWKSQVDVINYCQPHWKHADYTRQELLFQQQLQQGQAQEAIDDNLPVWQQVSKGTAFWQPAVSALLVGPPSLFVTQDADDVSNKNTHKLFTNLFLPGNALAGWLRAMLWLTVPAPEISVLLLDWSSLFLSKSTAQFSSVTLPILQSLVTLQIGQLRQLVFGQVLVAANSGSTVASENQDWNFLVTQRNDHALQVLQTLLKQNSKKCTALLYGCSHCPDLHAKLVQDHGFKPTKTEWRTAWSVSVPNTFNGKNPVHAAGKSKNTPETVWSDLYTFLPPTAWAALVVLFPLYLGVAAVDWIDCIHSSTVSLWEDHDSVSFVTEWMLYLLRHVLLYVGVSKFALEWQDPDNR